MDVQPCAPCGGYPSLPCGGRHASVTPVAEDEHRGARPNGRNGPHGIGQIPTHDILVGKRSVRLAVERGQVERRGGHHRTADVAAPRQEVGHDGPAGGEADERQVLDAVAVPQLRQRIVDQLDLVRGVPISRMVTGGPVHARSGQQHHGPPARRGAQRLRRGLHVSGDVS